MIGWKRRILLKDYLEQGMTKTAVAEKFGVSRRTVHHWIKTGQLDRDLSPETVRYGPDRRFPVRSIPTKAIILERLDAYPELSAVRLFEEIKAAGYPGGYTQVKEYVRTVRPQPPEETHRPLRDASGPPRAGGLCRLPPALGQAIRPARRAGLFPHLLAASFSGVRP